MVDRHRCELPGATHHVMNRGVARRTVIEGRRDADEFLAGVQRVVEEGLLEVHAYSLMGTHYHMLVRSPQGELSRAMMLVQNHYARWFNRGRRRDGPLWRGRFLSKRVRSGVYWRILVRYIDQNPVQAHVVTTPDAYELGSAWHYARTRTGPAWLSRGEIEKVVAERSGRPTYDPRDYSSVFGEPLSSSAHWMLERNGFARSDAEDAFADLVAAAPESVRRWMRRKAQLADGSAAIGVGMIDPEVLLTSVAPLQADDPSWSVQPRLRSKPGWQALRCALLHQVCGCAADDIAARAGVGTTTARRHLQEHSDLLLSDPVYEEKCGEVVSRLLAGEYGDCA